MDCSAKGVSLQVKWCFFADLPTFLGDEGFKLHRRSAEDGVGGGAFGAFGLFHTFICMQPFYTKRSFKCLGFYLHNRNCKVSAGRKNSQQQEKGRNAYFWQNRTVDHRDKSMTGKGRRRDLETMLDDSNHYYVNK